MKRWYEFCAQARGAEIVIYDEIGAFGVPAKAFLDELKVLGPVPEITLRINSPGGHVFDGVAASSAARLQKRVWRQCLGQDAFGRHSLCSTVGPVKRRSPL